MLTQSTRIFVAGHRGLVGSAILRGLQMAGHTNLLTRTRAELDLTDRKAVRVFFRESRPQHVILAAAKVGGIVANANFPADFIRENLQIQTNVIEAAFEVGVERLLFLGSSCIYPKFAPQPIKEEYLLTGPLERTNRPYALAKIAGIEMCWSYNRQHGTRYLAAMPTNLYGPNDNFHPEHSHVIPALVRRFVHARMEGAMEVEVWGSGKPFREFLHSDDLAAACLYLMGLDEPAFDALLGTDSDDQFAPPLINIGSGGDVSISELAHMIAKAAGFQGKIRFDASKPDGTPKKLMDSSRLFGLGWRPRIELQQGLEQVVEAYGQMVGSSAGQ
ncbi:MAG: GDP-L-fucose synthase family protein [Sandaracinobacter sp.]